MDRPPTVPPPGRRFAAVAPPPNYETEPVTLAERTTYEDWAKERNTPDWLLAAARARAGWPEGQEISEADYDAAITAVQNIEVR